MTLRVMLFSPTPCSQRPSVYFPPLISETKFNTHIETQAKFYVFHFLHFSTADGKREGSELNGSKLYDNSVFP
jgi:hypothetical protein